MAVCDLYSHNHASVIIEAHHVVPKSWFVGVVDTPMARLCPNCHMNVHLAVDAALGGGSIDTSGVPPRCKQLALEALKLAKEKGLTPKPTL